VDKRWTVIANRTVSILRIVVQMRAHFVAFAPPCVGMASVNRPKCAVVCPTVALRVEMARAIVGRSRARASRTVAIPTRVWASVVVRPRTALVSPTVCKQGNVVWTRVRPVGSALVYVTMGSARRARRAVAPPIVGLRVGTTRVIVGRRRRLVPRTARSRPIVKECVADKPCQDAIAHRIVCSSRIVARMRVPSVASAMRSQPTCPVRANAVERRSTAGVIPSASPRLIAAPTPVQSAELVPAVAMGSAIRSKTPADARWIVALIAAMARVTVKKAPPRVRAIARIQTLVPVNAVAMWAIAGVMGTASCRRTAATTHAVNVGPVRTAKTWSPGPRTRRSLWLRRVALTATILRMWPTSLSSPTHSRTRW
jgi:hypothetical protein